MCNCNQQRAAYTAQQQRQSHPQRGMIQVKLIGNTPMVINGNITGRTYTFLQRNDQNWVDSRDALYMKEIPGLQVL